MLFFCYQLYLNECVLASKNKTQQKNDKLLWAVYISNLFILYTTINIYTYTYMNMHICGKL